MKIWRPPADRRFPVRVTKSRRGGKAGGGIVVKRGQRIDGIRVEGKVRECGGSLRRGRTATGQEL